MCLTPFPDLILYPTGRASNLYQLCSIQWSIPGLFSFRVVVACFPDVHGSIKVDCPSDCVSRTHPDRAVEPRVNLSFYVVVPPVPSRSCSSVGEDPVSRFCIQFCWPAARGGLLTTSHRSQLGEVRSSLWVQGHRSHYCVSNVETDFRVMQGLAEIEQQGIQHRRRYGYISW